MNLAGLQGNQPFHIILNRRLWLWYLFRHSWKLGMISVLLKLAACFLFRRTELITSSRSRSQVLVNLSWRCRYHITTARRHFFFILILDDCYTHKHYIWHFQLTNYMCLLDIWNNQGITSPVGLRRGWETLDHVWEFERFCSRRPWQNQWQRQEMVAKILQSQQKHGIYIRTHNTKASTYLKFYPINYMHYLYNNFIAN